MATIKSYTDLEQSRQLAVFLPVETADLCYIAHSELINIYEPFYKKADKEDIPCWSLASLLAILPNEILTDNRFECHYQIHIRKYDGDNKTTLYQIAYGNNRGLSGSWHDMINTGEKESLIDACYDMIIELKEMNFL